MSHVSSLVGALAVQEFRIEVNSQASVVSADDAIPWLSNSQWEAWQALGLRGTP